MKKIEGIRKNFSKLKAEIDEKKAESIGVVELRKYTASILALQEENTRIKEDCRYDVNIGLDDLGTIFKDSEDLWNEMSETLDLISDILESKQNQVDEMGNEVSRQRAIINMYEKKIKEYTAMTKNDTKVLNDEEADSELQKLVNSEFEFETKKLEKLNELMDKHVSICKEINADIYVLRYGGVLKPKTKKEKAKESTNEIDALFMDGLNEELWDKAFVNGNGEDVPTPPEVGEEETREVPTLEDGDLAELVLPDLGETRPKEEKEIIPVTVEETPAEVKEEPEHNEESEEVKGNEMLPEEPTMPDVTLPEEPVETEPTEEPGMPETAPVEETPAPEMPAETVLPGEPEEPIMPDLTLPAEPVDTETEVRLPEEAAEVSVPVETPAEDVVLPPEPVETEGEVVLPSAPAEADVTLPDEPVDLVTPDVQLPAEPVEVEGTVDLPAEPVDTEGEAIEDAMKNFDWAGYFENIGSENKSL
jgi:hypothetical protein